MSPEPETFLRVLHQTYKFVRLLKFDSIYRLETGDGPLTRRVWYGWTAADAIRNAWENAWEPCVGVPQAVET